MRISIGTPTSCIYFGCQREPGPSAGRDQGLVSDAGRRCGCRRSRLRQRAGRATPLLGDRSLVEKAAEWTSLQGLVRIEAEHYYKATGKTEREIRYYITSLRPDAERLNRAIHQHWSIENKLHWVLDVSFGEDLSRKRAGHAAQNFSVLNRIVPNLLKQDKSSGRGVHGKRLSRMG
ncbi:MAG: ISAs1 family transposase [Acidobacteriaceae bacterium]